MTLRTKLAFGILVIAVVLLAPLWISTGALRDLHGGLETLRQREFAAAIAVGRLRSSAEELRTRETQVAVEPNDTVLQRQLETTLDTITEISSRLRTSGLDSSATVVDDALRVISEYIPIEIAAARRDQARQTDAADSISRSFVRPAIARVEMAARTAEGDIRVRMADLVERSAGAVAEAQRATNTALIGAMILATIIGIWLTASISRPVEHLEHGMQAVADGDFEHELALEPDRGDEFGRLASSYVAMTSQLKQLDKLKAEFVSVASHELKTPINVILGYLQLMQEGVYGDLTPKQREICLTLSGQAQSLARLVRQLLDISRFEAGGGKLDPRPVRLSAFLAELENAFRVLALQRGILFQIERGPGIPAMVTWDEDRMNEVLGNLLSNAFKFTDRGGSVELAIRGIGHAVHMEVRDTGAGIPPDQLPRIFDKFYQASNQASAAAKGTGLGLAIAKGIVEAHGGQIRVESTVGLGTTFTIELPVDASGRRGALAAKTEAHEIRETAGVGA